MARVLRLVTYNIHKGIGGVDRRYRPERIIGVLEACDADIAFLQEVDEGVPRSRGHRQVDLLGDTLGYEHRAYYPNVSLRRGHYGNAILSRFPLDHDENIDLTVRFKKRRSALHARCSIDHDGDHLRVWLFNVHLGLAAIERRTQLRRLLEWTRQHRMHHQDTLGVIAGDFNDVWGRLGKSILLPEGFTTAPRSLATFPAIRPVRPLDRCYVRGPGAILHAHHRFGTLARTASDHLPLLSEISLQ
jgi:endonuclease/exonuclease/phosphatase family metal-dependent hydrolase